VKVSNERCEKDLCRATSRYAIQTEGYRSKRTNRSYNPISTRQNDPTKCVKVGFVGEKDCSIRVC
jgi:hypothetical protein